VTPSRWDATRSRAPRRGPPAGAAVSRSRGRGGGLAPSNLREGIFRNDLITDQGEYALARRLSRRARGPAPPALLKPRPSRRLPFRRIVEVPARLAPDRGSPAEQPERRLRRHPHDRVTVITGVSRLGKSSLAFDTLREGQCGTSSSLSTYRPHVPGASRPADVDRIEHIRPASRSSEEPGAHRALHGGTATELHDYLRLLSPRSAACTAPPAGGSAERLADQVATPPP